MHISLMSVPTSANLHTCACKNESHWSWSRLALYENFVKNLIVLGEPHLIICTQHCVC